MHVHMNGCLQSFSTPSQNWECAVVLPVKENLVLPTLSINLPKPLSVQEDSLSMPYS